MALLPLIVLSVVVFVGLGRLDSAAETKAEESRQVLSDESIAATSEDQAVSIAREINLILAERIVDVTDWARDPVITADVFKAEQFAIEEGLVGRPIEELEEEYETRKSTGVALDAQEHLRDELTRKTEFSEVFFTDVHGYNAAWTTRTSDFVQSDEEWWQDAWENGLSISDVEFDESANVFSVDIAVRIDNVNTKRRLGVMKSSLSISFVQDIATARSSENINYIVALDDGRLLAETASEHDVARMMNGDIDATEGSTGLAAALEATTAGTNITEDLVSGYTRTTDPDFFGDKFDGFQGFDWIVVSDQPAEAAFAPLRGLEELSTEIKSSGSDLRAAIILMLFIGLVAAFGMSRLLSRSIVGPIQQLTKAASNAATRELPWAVRKIDEEDADLDAVSVTEISLETGDELEMLANSFNSVQGTALELASVQALNRRNTSDMFVNLGRRNNSLIKRQLRFIDRLEKSEADPETLESLFKLDHLATRMRRNAESLLVLAGERAPRRWSAPVAIGDTVQSALAEVEEYERVDMSGIDQAHIQGSAVADVAHLLAELIENALDFSPPDAPVVVSGQAGSDGRGYTLTVADEGLGMKEEELADANARLAADQELTRVPSQQLGLFVVGRLCQRHDISVTMSNGNNGGTIATIKLPTALTEHAADDDSQQDGSADETESTTEVEAETGTEVEAEVEVDVEAPSADDSVDGTSDEETEEETVVVSAIGETTTDEDEDEEVESTVGEEPAESEAVRAGDADERSAKQRRGMDDAPHVDVAGFDFPRRESTKSTQAEAAAPEAASPSAEAATDRGAPSEDELAKFGFTRRQSADESGESGDSAPPSMEPAAVASRPLADESEEGVEEVAKANKSQWSSFQKAKKAAESDPTDE